MRKPAAALIFILLAVCAVLSTGAKAEEEAQMKKVVAVIAHQDFRDEEFLEPAEILENKGIEVKVASSKLGPAKGSQGAMIKPDMLVREISVNDFDAIMFVGGAGATEYWDDPAAQKLAQDFYNSGKVVAAICIAPVTLAKAGILSGKRATVWSSEASQLKSAGADYTGKPVEADGKIITAAGPFAAKDFGEQLAKALER
jgi:protease I